MSTFPNLNSVLKELDEIREDGVSFSGRAINWSSTADAQNLIEAINKCTNLTFLNLEGNTLGVEAAEVIAKALEKHPEMRQALWKDLFTGRLKTEIPKALIHLGNGLATAGAKLKVLDCSDNALGPNGMVGLVDLLKSPVCYELEVIKLNNCGLGITGGTMLASALTDCHKNSTEAGTPLQLKTFIAGRNRLENDGAIALAKIFATIGTLVEVAMPQNGIYHVGIAALAKAFERNRNMEDLNLNDNTIGPEGATKLAEAFSHMPKLKIINFGDCLLKTKGAILLSESLQDSHTDLEVINFESNEIGANGGFAVVSAIKNKKKLKNLIINGNQFGETACEKIKTDVAKVNNISCDLEDDEGEEEEDDEANGGNDNDYEDVDEENDDDEEDDYEDYEDYNSEQSVEEKYGREEGNTSSNGPNNLTDDSITEITVINISYAIENFYNTPIPTEHMFNLIEDDKIDKFRYFLRQIPKENYLTVLVFTILKCSSLSLESKDALAVSICLYNDAFTYAKENNQTTRIRNFFLKQLDLLKCENKRFKPEYNVTACRYALEMAMKLDTFPNDAKTLFSSFLQKVK